MEQSREDKTRVSPTSIETKKTPGGWVGAVAMPHSWSLSKHNPDYHDRKPKAKITIIEVPL